jgi:phosphodiester glycosidase
MSTPQNKSTLCLAAAALVLVSTLGGCSPPDRPAGIAADLPHALLARLAADTVRSVRVAEGVWYRYLWSEEGPWGLHLTEVDLSDCAMQFTTLTSDQVTHERRSFARVSEMATAAHVLAAVNGDFFLVEGIPAGPEVHDGTVRRRRSRPGFAWSPSIGSWIGKVELLADGALRVDGVTVDDATEVLGGTPRLIDGGVFVYDTTLAEGFRNGRHPRTAVGMNANRTRLWLVVVDGRQDYSDGMTLPELREFFVLLGVDQALNLDGGGSSTMVVGGRVVNRPSDAAGERPVVNGLGLTRDPSLCEVASEFEVRSDSPS